MVNILDLLNGLENGKDEQSIAEAFAKAAKMQRAASPVDKTRDRMAAQKHVSARKAELQAKRGHREAAQAVLSLEGQSLEGLSLEGLSLEDSPSDVPTKHRQKAAYQQPERPEESLSSDHNEWMEGFDIRRAVVWSEILRPKFQEDEGLDGFGRLY